MKIIQDRELSRICMMVDGDKEMSQLAGTILKRKEIVRFSWATICLLHIVAFVATLTYGTYLATTYKLGLYYIPVITVCLLQAVWSVIHLITIAEFRKTYNSHIKKIVND